MIVLTRVRTMPRRKNSTSFKPGHRRSPESIERQRATMRRQLAAGERQLPTRPWGEARRAAHREKARRGELDRIPVGSRRKSWHGRRDLEYWEIKIGPGRHGWVYE